MSNDNPSAAFSLAEFEADDTAVLDVQNLLDQDQLVEQ